MFNKYTENKIYYHKEDTAGIKEKHLKQQNIPGKGGKSHTRKEKE